MINKKYNILYVDPPWQYNNKNTGGSMNSGASCKYETLSLEQLKSINLPTEKDSCLFLWCPVPIIEYGLELLKTWEFKYKTAIFWNKIGRLGMGYWFRGQVEILLFGIKGSIKAFKCQELNIINHKVLKHSEKPEIFRQLIDKATINITNPKKVELFAKKYSDNWDCYGLELNNYDILAWK